MSVEESDSDEMMVSVACHETVTVTGGGRRRGGGQSHACLPAWTTTCPLPIPHLILASLTPGIPAPPCLSLSCLCILYERERKEERRRREVGEGVFCIQGGKLKVMTFREVERKEEEENVFYHLPPSLPMPQCPITT